MVYLESDSVLITCMAVRTEIHVRVKPAKGDGDGVPALS